MSSALDSFQSLKQQDRLDFVIKVPQLLENYLQSTLRVTSFGAEKNYLCQNSQYFRFCFHLILPYLLHLFFHETNAAGYFVEQNNTRNAASWKNSCHCLDYIMSDHLIHRIRLLKAGYFFLDLMLKYQSMSLENIYHLGFNQS